MPPTDTKALIEKIETLPLERIAEIEDFVDFIRERERQSAARTRAAATASALSFTAIWNNPDDAEYDAL